MREDAFIITVSVIQISCAILVNSVYHLILELKSRMAT